MFLPLLNFFLIVLIGRYALSGIMYPYQNAVIREELDRNNASRFGHEFSHYLECLVYTIRVQAGMDDDEIERNSVKGKLIDVDEQEFEYLSFISVKNTIDLLNLYLDINKQVLLKKKMPKNFVQFQAIM